MHHIQLLGVTTPDNMIAVKYDRAKYICKCIWDRPCTVGYFDDIFHDTIYYCLKALGPDKRDQDYMKNYFFKAFRINMIRHFGYSYNKFRSGLEIECAVIPVEYDYDSRMDGFQMMDYVKRTYGKDMHDMLWDNLNGYTYAELDKKYDVNSFYVLGKTKDALKRVYNPIRVVKLR